MVSWLLKSLYTTYQYLNEKILIYFLSEAPSCQHYNYRKV